MEIHDSHDALFIAVEMERRAISFYERADMVFENSALRNTIVQLRKDEITHLNRFESLLDSQTGQDEASLLLSAEASGLLFPGGLLEAARKGAFDSRESLIRYAAGQEESAVRAYQDYAALCEGTARDTFLSIAGEEETHLLTLRNMLPQGKGV